MNKTTELYYKHLFSNIENIDLDNEEDFTCPGDFIDAFHQVTSDTLRSWPFNLDLHDLEIDYKLEDKALDKIQHLYYS